MKYTLSLLLIFAATATLWCQTPEAAAKAITPAGLLNHMKVLASDEFEGRGVATPGEDKSVAYLQNQMQKMGLKPGNPDGTWVQKVSLAGIKSKATTEWQIKGKPISLVEQQDIVTISRHYTANVDITKSDVVFVGYGVVAPEYGWDDYKGVDVRGKTIVMLINDPQIPDAAHPGQLDDKLFKGRAMTYYGRWTYKYEIASKKGAAAAIIIHETDLAAYPFEVVKGSYGLENFDLARADGNRGRVAVEAWITRPKAVEIAAAAGYTLEDLKARALRKDFKPVSLGGTATFHIQNTLRQVDSRNVVGLLPGSDPALKNEYVIFSAHWDHLGRNPSLSGDQIYNGAVDNAAGCAAILQIAEAFTKLPKAPKRSTLFFFPTAEEKGLLGTLYYADHPLYPLRKTIADFNVDGFNTWGETHDVVIIGKGASTLDDLTTRLAAQQGRVVKPDPEPEKGSFYRSDHVELMKKGIPALYLKPGTDFTGQDPQFGSDKNHEYTAQRYHKVTDEVDPRWDLRGAAQDMQLLFLAGEAVADAKAMADWKPGSEFKRQ